MLGRHLPKSHSVSLPNPLSPSSGSHIHMQHNQAQSTHLFLLQTSRLWEARGGWPHARVLIPGVLDFQAVRESLGHTRGCSWPGSHRPGTDGRCNARWPWLGWAALLVCIKGVPAKGPHLPSKRELSLILEGASLYTQVFLVLRRRPAWLAGCAGAQRCSVVGSEWEPWGEQRRQPLPCMPSPLQSCSQIHLPRPMDLHPRSFLSTLLASLKIRTGVAARPEACPLA